MSYSKRKNFQRIEMESDVLFENYRKSLEGLKNTSSCSQYPLNYYDLLEITPSANQTTIKKAFQKKVMKVHPDKGGNQEMFLKVMKAYKVLSDLTTKEVYDNYGERGLNEYFGFIY